VTSTRPGQPATANQATNGPRAAVSPADHTAPPPGRLTEPALWALVIRHARCSQSGLDPDQWFPASADPSRARQEAAAAIAICATCPVRGHCLTLSLQHWDIGQHGVWGGLVAADRARLRRRARPHRGWMEEQAMASMGAPHEQQCLAGGCEDRK
jgi:Transcription factor WhiB